MALYFELELLEDLISITLNPKNFTNENSVKNQYNKWSRLAITERERIKKKLRNGLLCIQKEKQRKIYIQQHQSSIIHLQNKLSEYLHALNSNRSTGKRTSTQLILVYRHFNQCLEDLLSFLEKNFTDYFNLEERISADYAQAFQEEYSSRLKSLHKQLLQTGLDKALPQMLFSTINDLFYGKKSITYRDIDYIKELTEELENVSSRKPITHYPTLAEILIELNFNCPDFKNYFLHFIKEEINKADSINEKLEKIYYHVKEISLIRARKGRRLFPDALSVQTHIAGYLQREWHYVKKKQSLSVSDSSNNKENDEEPLEAIHLQMSVEELGLLTNIQKQAGLLKNTNMRSLAKLLAANHRSLRKDKLSWQNLYNCFSKVEMTTINSLDDKLITMVNTLRKIKSDLKNN